MRNIYISGLVFLFIALCIISCQQNDEKPEYVVNIDSIEGLWDINDWELYENGKMVESTFEYTKPGTMPVKHQQFLDLIFYSDGKCRQLYYEPVLSLEPKDIYFYSELSWSYNAETKEITLTNSSIDGSYSTTKLKILHFDDDEFILEGLQPTPTNLANTFYRLYGKIGSDEQKVEAERLYANDKLL